MNLLKYKSYIGDIQVSVEDDVLYGKLLYISAIAAYEGHSVDEIKISFEEVVDDYLKTCKKKGYQPEVSCKGSFNIRIGHDLHFFARFKRAIFRDNFLQHYES